MSYAIWLTAGVLLGLLFRALSLSKGTEKAVLEWTDRIAIRVLLPTHVLLSTQIMDTLPLGLLMALIVGAALPWLVYFAGRGLPRLLGWKAPPNQALVGATFGGGNRGILVLSILVAMHLPSAVSMPTDQPTLYDYFATIDLAYFLVLLGGVQAFHYATTPSGSPARESISFQLFSAFIMLSGFLLALGSIRVLHGEFWQQARSSLGYGITLICTALVVARAQFEFSVTTLNAMGGIFLARLVAITVLAALISIAAVPDIVALLEMLIVLSIFLLVPPSSYAPSIIARHESDQAAAQVATIVATWNIVYLVFACGVAFAGALRLLAEHLI